MLVMLFSMLVFICSSIGATSASSSGVLKSTRFPADSPLVLAEAMMDSFNQDTVKSKEYTSTISVPSAPGFLSDTGSRQGNFQSPDSNTSETLESNLGPNAQEKTSIQIQEPKSIGKKNSPADTSKLQLEVKDESLTNLFRLISKSYKVNIIPSPELDKIRTSIHLTGISLGEGLNAIARANNLQIEVVEGIYYIKLAGPPELLEMQLKKKTIDIRVENQEVKTFIKDFTKKTGISIVPGQNLQGKVTGHLTEVDPVDGFKAVMAANRFEVRKKNGIYIVEPEGKSGDDNPSMRMGRMNMGGGGSGTMDIDAKDNLVTVSLKGADLGQAIRSIIDQTNKQMVIYGQLDGTVDAELHEKPIDEALGILLQGTRFTYVMRDSMILIGENNPNSPTGAILSRSELVHLKHIRVDNLLTILPKNIMADGIQIVKEQNAVLITGTASYLQQLKSFLKEVDLPVPQVSIEVVIVEYTRKNESSLGVSTQNEEPKATLYNQPAGLIGLDLPILLDKVVDQGPFKHTGITVLPQDFTLRLSSSLSKEKGKILAMPKVTTLNGNKASLRVSTSQYFPVTTLNQEGLPSTDFRTISDGITIDLTPWVTKHGDVNLEIQPSIKTAKPPTTSNNVERPGDVSDRAITSNVRLMDGQTLILGGLIDTKENVTRTFVPILGSIPLLGYLFSNKAKTFVTTELVLFVTPRVLGPNNQNVDLKKELEKIEDRGGNIKSKDIIKESSRKTKK